MPIKVYQSKRNKKLYEVYVSIKSKGERLQKEEERIFRGILFLLFQQPKRLSLS